MNLFVDTSVWSLAFRRDSRASEPEVDMLVEALGSGHTILTTGLVLQEILQGFSGPRARDRILEHFSALPLLVPNRQDHIEAANLRNTCRQAGVQVGTVDALLAQLCIHHGLTLLTTDGDFRNVSAHCPLEVWKP